MRGLTAAALILLATVAWGDVYTWKDASGKTHYSDTPPPGVDARRLGPVASPPAAASEQRRSLAEREADFRKRRAESEEQRAKADKEKADAEQRAKACEDAKRYLTALESGQRVARYSESGERVFLDDNEREAATADARKRIHDFCK
ncbi:MAG: DUF4124 domain-containing protein [Pseudomonadota bacterium]|jgi:hypothetical protein